MRVVVLTTYADDESIMAALSAGATGYLTKDATKNDIRTALEAAAAGQAVLDPIVQATLLEAAKSRPPAVIRAGPCPTGSRSGRLKCWPSSGRVCPTPR